MKVVKTESYYKPQQCPICSREVYLILILDNGERMCSKCFDNRKR